MIRIAFLLAALVAASPAALAAQQRPPDSDDVKKIKKLYLAYDEEGAYAACNEFLALHPGDPIVLELRGWCLRQMGRFDEAARTLDTINPKSTRVKLLLAECLGMNKATATQAQTIVDEVSADDPNFVDPHVTRARIYLANGKLKEAAAEVSYVRTTKPKLFEGQLLAGILAESNGFHDEALKLYLPLVQKGEDFDRTDTHHDRDAAVALAGCFTKLQRYDDAIGMYEQLTAKFSKAPMLYSQYALALSMQERNAEAIAASEKAVELAPASPDLRSQLATLYRGAGRTQDAIQQFEKVIESGAKGNAQVIADLRLAELYLETAVLDRASAHAAACLAVAPTHEEVLSVNARVREKLGDVPAAKDLYRKALATNPLMFDSLYRLAQLLARSDDPNEQEEGKKLLERHKKIEPVAADIQRVQRAIEINPRNPLNFTMLCGFLNVAGEYDQARRWGEVALKLNPRNPATCVQLGFIAANTGDTVTALKYLEMAQGLLPKGSSLELDGYVEKLKKGEPLPLPLGRIERPAQKKPESPPGSAPKDPAAKQDPSTPQKPKSDGGK